jgi:hypothetical protein
MYIPMNSQIKIGKFALSLTQDSEIRGKRTVIQYVSTFYYPILKTHEGGVASLPTSCYQNSYSYVI